MKIQNIDCATIETAKDMTQQIAESVNYDETTFFDLLEKCGFVSVKIASHTASD